MFGHRLGSGRPKNLQDNYCPLLRSLAVLSRRQQPCPYTKILEWGEALDDRYNPGHLQGGPSYQTFCQLAILYLLILYLLILYLQSLVMELPLAIRPHPAMEVLRPFSLLSLEEEVWVQRQTLGPNLHKDFEGK